MSTAEQETRQTAKLQEQSAWPHVRLPETDRLEAFSDNVLSITITLLVAEIVRPEYASGQIAGKASGTMGQLHRVPVVLCRRDLAQSPGGIRAGALLRPRFAPGQPLPPADVGVDSVSDRGAVRGHPKRH
jgi:hypothetical protein